jgi:hypothetical protein
MKRNSQQYEGRFKSQVKEKKAQKGPAEKNEKTDASSKIQEFDQTNQKPLLEVQQKSQQKLADATNNDPAAAQAAVAKDADKAADVTLQELQKDMLNAETAQNSTNQNSANATQELGSTADPPNAPNNTANKTEQQKAEEKLKQEENTPAPIDIQKEEENALKVVADTAAQGDAQVASAGLGAASTATKQAQKDHEEVANNVLKLSETVEAADKAVQDAPTLAKKVEALAELSNAQADAQKAEIQEVGQRAEVLTLTKSEKVAQVAVQTAEAAVAVTNASISIPDVKALPNPAKEVECIYDKDNPEKKVDEATAYASGASENGSNENVLILGNESAPVTSEAANASVVTNTTSNAGNGTAPQAGTPTQAPTQNGAPVDSITAAAAKLPLNLGALTPIPEGFVPNYACSNKWDDEECASIDEQCETSVAFRMKCRKTCGSCKQAFAVDEPTDDELRKEMRETSERMYSSVYELDDARELGQGRGDITRETYDDVRQDVLDEHTGASYDSLYHNVAKQDPDEGAKGNTFMGRVSNLWNRYFHSAPQPVQRQVHTAASYDVSALPQQRDDVAMLNEDAHY